MDRAALSTDDLASFDLADFITQAWQQHAQHPAAVAQSLAGLSLHRLDTEASLLKLSHLGQHVLGEHLGRWADAVAWQQRLAALPVCGPEGQAATCRCIAGLQLAARAPAPGPADDPHDPRHTLSASDAVRATALAAASLVPHDVVRASTLLHDALARFDTAALPAIDPCTRALAVTGNNLACELEEKPARNAAETALMLQAAQTARRFWALAGGWLETERADYRLAMSWLQAGDAAQALVHAERCLALIDAQAAAPALALERFFGHEARARAAGALRRADLLADSRARAEAAFQALPPEDQAGCRATLEQLAQTLA